MRGEPIQAVNVGLQSLLASLRQNPFALESVYLSIITFDAVALPEIVCPESGPTFLGEALHSICDQVARDVRTASAERKGDWRPLLFITL